LFKKIGAGLYSPTPNIIEPEKALLHDGELLMIKHNHFD
jgi:hypothetical protein